MHFNSLSLSYTFCCQYLLYPDHCVIHSSAAQQRRRSESMMRSSVVIVVISIILYIGTYAFWNNVNRNGVRDFCVPVEGSTNTFLFVGFEVTKHTWESGTYFAGKMTLIAVARGIKYVANQRRDPVINFLNDSGQAFLVGNAIAFFGHLLWSNQSAGIFTFFTGVAMFSVLYPLCNYVLRLLFNP